MRTRPTVLVLGVLLIPSYLDTTPLLAPGAIAGWKYQAASRFQDEQVGQWSDVVSASVMG